MAVLTDDFCKEGSKVFRKAPINRESIRGWASSIAPSERDVELALQAMNRLVPVLLKRLRAHLGTS